MRADFRPERTDFWPERTDFRSKRSNGGTNERKDGQMKDPLFYRT